MAKPSGFATLHVMVSADGTIRAEEFECARMSAGVTGITISPRRRDVRGCPNIELLVVLKSRSDTVRV